MSTRHEIKSNYHILLLSHSAESARWFSEASNRDVSTGPLASPFARSLTPLTCLLAPDCSLCSRPRLRSLIRSLVHFAHSLTLGKVYNLMSQYHTVLNHSAPPPSFFRRGFPVTTSLPQFRSDHWKPWRPGKLRDNGIRLKTGW